MKRKLFALLALAALYCGTSWSRTPAPSPLQGRWAIDVATLPMPPEARPKSVILEFKDAGQGRWSTRVDSVDPSGGTMKAEATLPLDGSPGEVSGNYWANETAMKMPAPNVLVMQLVDHGTPSSTRIYTVGPDGQTLTETKAFFTRDGKPVLQTNLFKRVRAAGS